VTYGGGRSAACFYAFLMLFSCFYALLVLFDAF